jgi:hypothetical protein
MLNSELIDSLLYVLTNASANNSEAETTLILGDISSLILSVSITKRDPDQIDSAFQQQNPKALDE